MTITRIGSNATYANGWETAFGKGKKKTSSTATKAATKTAKKAPSKKKAAPKKKAKK